MQTQGIFEAERVFGSTIVNSDGRVVPVRYIGEQHVKEDCGGRIPTVADWFKNIKMEVWMNRGYKVDKMTDSQDVATTEEVK